MKTEKRPFLSIIVPTFHSENTIFYCLDSIKKQTFSDYEVIVVDASGDNKTEEVVKEWLSIFTRITYCRLDTPGTPRQVSFGIRKSKGQFVGFVDSDDYIHPRMFEILVENQMKYGVDISSCRLQHTEKYRSYPPSSSIGERGVVNVFTGRRYKELTNHFTEHNCYSRYLHIVRRTNALDRLSYYEALKRNHWEDVIYVYGVLLSSKSAVIEDTSLYYYVFGGDRPNTRPISDPVDILEYLVSHQQIAKKMFLEAGNKAGIGQTYWPLMREFTYAIHRPEVAESKERYNAFVKKIRKLMAHPLWNIPMREVHGQYEKKVIWLCRLNLYNLLYRRIHRRD